jgi:hypothetical protein
VGEEFSKVLSGTAINGLRYCAELDVKAFGWLQEDNKDAM